MVRPQKPWISPSYGSINGLGLKTLLKRVFEFSSFFEWVWIRNVMESCLSFNVWTRGFDKRDLRELLALSLREKRVKWGEKFWFVWTHGKWEQENFLDVLVVLRKVKEEVRCNLVIAWPAKSWSLGFKGMTCVNMHDALALYALNFNWLHV